ncbi:hypothetical protein [Ligilactobacillus murinus]|uniref:hypothetical protein n=1 Tax=Ligilactobacillus murinus TaxID=1622 RepID=UPI001094204D|nr:hypothetical protein [Ligilactobacillus murinus]TGY52334.1 hypothetical protein E5341_06630 [Ligilactobacillus murinus]
MLYERKDNEIITEAIDIMGDNISFAVTDDGMLSDNSYMYGEAFMSGVEDRWNDKEARLIIEFYGCGLFNDEIVCRTDYGLERAIVRMIQAVTALEEYLYSLPKQMERQNDR